MSYSLRKACIADVPAIYELLKGQAGQGLLLPRSRANLFEMVQTFHVAEENETKKVIGTAALQVAWEDLAEVRSLAVDDKHRGHSLGRDLTLAVEKEAIELGVARMFVLTYIPAFFERYGYGIVPLESLPQKIWSICFQCVHYPNCQETALVKVF